jgi:hypothetical protein
MLFDYCIGNPAFNVAQSNNVAGTGGNTTLYRTATRNDFDNRLQNNGTLINITLKGIIPDLVNGHFKDQQVNWIHLMDNIDVWPYNTCIFSVSKTPRTSPPVILGGLAAKIYSPNASDCFPFVYYSGANNGMNKQFGPGKPNKVIRQLPGKGRNSVAYDYTDAVVPVGPKFAFYVMESRKSYTVTSDPILGGTICYIATSTEDEAAKLKLFVEKNPIFAMYVKRMKLRGHAFGLRHMRKFDINQIVTGLEIPKEWNITAHDLVEPAVFTNEITEDRNRVKALGEVFTPTSLVKFTLDIAEQYTPSMFNHSNITFLDSMCGDGQFLIEILNRKIQNGITADHALQTIYGIDLTQENVDVCRLRLLDQRHDLENITNRNIVCEDSLVYNCEFSQFGNGLFLET